MDRILSVSFVLALLLPAAWSLVGSNKSHSINEYRLLASFPGFGASAVHLQVFAKQFEIYCSDHFGGRERLIACHLKIKRALFSDDFGPDSLQGRDGWLYYSGAGMIDNYRGTPKLTRAQLEAWKTLLENRRDWLAARGIKFLFVVAPNKESVYPEYLPAWLNQCSTTKVDDLMAYMRLHSTVEVLDLRPVLRKARGHDAVFYKTDSHWNLLGGFAACNAIISKISNQIPGLNPNPMENFDVQQESAIGGDLARFGGALDMIESNRYVFTPKTPLAKMEIRGATGETIDPRQLASLPVIPTALTTINPERTARAVVFGDSFSIAFVPFLGCPFGEVVYFNREFFNPEVVTQKKPDIVITEMVERTLNNTDPIIQLQTENP